MNTDRKLFGGFVGGILMTLSNFVVAFLQFRILLSYLPLETAGIWIIFLNIGAYILSLDLGLSPTLGREVSFISGTLNISEDERARRIGTLIRTCTIAVSALAATVFVCGITGGWLYLRTIVPSTIASQARPAWSIFVAGAALNLVGEGWFAGIYGLGQVFTERIIRAFGIILGLVFLSTALFLHTGMRGLAIAYVCQGACTILLARYALARSAKGQITKGTFEFELIRRLAMPSLKYAATLLGAILILQTDNLVIASVLGARYVPDYQAGAKLVTALMSLSMMLVVTSQPFISRAFAGDDIPEIIRILNRNLRYTLSVMVVLGSILACFADRVILLWLGKSHFVGFGVIWALLLMMLFESHHVAMASASVASGKIPFHIPALIAGALNLAFSIYLAKHYGLLGVAVGTLFAQLLTNNWFVPWYTMRLFHIKFADHLVQVILPVLGFIAVMLSSGAIMRHVSRTWPTVLSLMFGSAAELAIGTSYFMLVMVTPTERARIFKKLSSLGKQKFTVEPICEPPV